MSKSSRSWADLRSSPLFSCFLDKGATGLCTVYNPLGQIVRFNAQNRKHTTIEIGALVLMIAIKSFLKLCLRVRLFGFWVLFANPTLTSDDVVDNEPKDVACLRIGRAALASTKPM
jgi:hypothetical protein